MNVKNILPMFRRDESGNVAMMAALTFGMLAILVGAAVEYSSLTNRSQDLQNATDGAVLAAARSGETDLKLLEEIAAKVFEQNYTYNDGESLVEFVASVSEDDVLSLQVRLKKPNLFSGAVGDKDGYVTVEAASLLSSEMGLDVALVLDRTGSMAGTKMSGLKTATSQFIGDIESNDSDVRLSVTPFANYVNIGATTASRPWLDLPDMNLSGSDVTCTMQEISGSTCPSSTTSGGSSGSTGNSMLDQWRASRDAARAAAYGPATTSWSMTWTDAYVESNGAYCTANTDPTENSEGLVEECVPIQPAENWLGCVGSRAAPYNKQATADSQKIPLIYDRSCGQALTPLTNDLPRVRQNISDLTASGSTYIPSGLQWGWRTLTPEAPFESNDEGDRQKLLILMTDGDNTRSQSGTSHDGTDVAAANTLTLDLCNEIKASGIKLATVSYSQGGSGGSDDVLKQCASSPDLYFQAQDATKLRKAFEAAFESIRDVRLVY